MCQPWQSWIDWHEWMVLTPHQTVLTLDCQKCGSFDLLDVLLTLAQKLQFKTCEAQCAA